MLSFRCSCRARTLPRHEAAAEATAEPVVTSDAPTAPAGAHENPLPVGQVLAFGPVSAFQVGAAGPTQITPAYSVMPLTIQIDWATIKEQFPSDQSPAFTPWSNISVNFVTAAEKSYSTMDDYTVDIENELFDTGDVYEGKDIVQANVPISVPEAEIPGGTWVIMNNASGDKVFVAVR
jgi:hypothetical protein